jgi:hypothetical protein
MRYEHYAEFKMDEEAACGGKVGSTTTTLIVGTVSDETTITERSYNLRHVTHTGHRGTERCGGTLYVGVGKRSKLSFIHRQLWYPYQLVQIR